MKLDRQKVFEKCNWLCAYTWKPLWEDWQVDHITPKSSTLWRQPERTKQLMWLFISEVNHIDNLFPAIRIVNHYKRQLELEDFRKYMLRFHERLRKLPKNTSVERTKWRIEYINKIADLFDITVDKPFNWKFHFEKISN